MSEDLAKYNFAVKTLLFLSRYEHGPNNTQTCLQHRTILRILRRTEAVCVGDSQANSLTVVLSSMALVALAKQVQDRLQSVPRLIQHCATTSLALLRLTL